MNLDELIKANKSFNEINKTMVTDIIDSGITIIYGNSGVGKTYSTIKNLNNFKVKPILLDFDKNDRQMEKLDYVQLNGKYFIDNFNKNPKIDKYNTAISNTEKKLKVIITEHLKDEPFAPALIEANTLDIFDMTRYCTENGLIDDEAKKKCDNLIMMDVPNAEIISNETILIDTYQSAMFLFDNDIVAFKSFLDVLLKHGNNIIIVTHSKTLGNNEVVDMDEVFANHCDARIRLTRTQTRTKEESFCLFVEKLRGYTGKTKIEGWMR